MNDWPAIAAPASIGVTEDVPSPLTGISFTDVDAGSNAVQVTFTPTAGSLAAVSGGGVTVSLTPTDLILTGSIADLNAFLAAGNLAFTTAVHDIDPVLLRIILNDLGHSGSGGAGEETAYVDLIVTPANVNDPPVNAVPGSQTTGEDTPLTFSAARGNRLSISDADAGSNPVIVTLTATNGTLTLGSMAHLVFGTGDGTDDPSMTFVGTIDEINAALEGLVFTPTPQFHGGPTANHSERSRQRRLGRRKIDVDTIDITVTPVNDAPLMGDQSFLLAEHSLNGALVGSIVATDADLGDTLTFTVAGGDPAGVFGIDPATGAVTVVRGVDLVYETQNRYQISVRVTDSTGLSDTAVVTVNLRNVDTPPAAAGDRYLMDQFDTLAVPAGGVLANDIDVDHDPVIALLVAAPVHGVFSLAADGSFTYTPYNDFYGTDSFTYRPTDGVEDGAAVTVAIEVRQTGVLPGGDPGGDDGDDDGGDGGDDGDDGDSDPPSGDTPARTPRRGTRPAARPGQPRVAGHGRPRRRRSEIDDSATATARPALARRGTRPRPDRVCPRFGSRFQSPPGSARSVSAGVRFGSGPRARRLDMNTGLLWGQLDTLKQDLLDDVASEAFFQNLVVARPRRA